MYFIVYFLLQVQNFDLVLKCILMSKKGYSRIVYDHWSSFFSWLFDFAALICPPNSHYKFCMSRCQPTCARPRPPKCDKRCVEGCQCNKGYILSGDVCVKRSNCGCYRDGKYYMVRWRWGRVGLRFVKARSLFIFARVDRAKKRWYFYIKRFSWRSILFVKSVQLLGLSFWLNRWSNLISRHRVELYLHILKMLFNKKNF